MPQPTKYDVAGLLSLLIFIFCVSTLSYADGSLVVYSGRAERLIKPVLDTFQTESGISIQMLTADSTALVNRLKLEGKR